jgi:hypothetical protein
MTYTHAQVSRLKANIPHVAWTGGSTPSKWQQLHSRERDLVRAKFRDQMAIVKAYWHDYRGLSDSVMDQVRGQWRSARYDAHASIREAICK